MKQDFDISSVIEGNGDGVSIRVKVVPGASRTKVCGLLGDRLKVAVSAPPEGGKANKAVCAVIADLFAVSVKNVVVSSGQTNPQKTIDVIGLTACTATERLRAALSDPR